MPVRVQCPGCEKVLKAPDAARGKALKCPGCGARVPVPAARRKKAARRPAAQRPPTAASAPDEDFLGRLDLRYAEDRHTRICPKCATEVDEDDIECPACGVDLETGKLSEKQRRMRERKGPDPAAFYSRAWTDSWEFLLGHWTLALKSALIWGLAMTLVTVSSFTQLWVVQREFVHRKEVIAEESQQSQQDSETETPSDADIMIRAQISPPSLFWMGMGLLGNLAFVGWYWFLATKIISATMERKDKVTRLQVDWFANAALGIKGYVWPFVLVLPFWFLPPVWLLPILCLPIALVHMTQKYTYKAYLPWDMFRIFCKTTSPSMYLLMMAIVVHLGVLIAAIVLTIVMPGRTLETYVTLHAKLYQWLNEISFGMDEGFFRFVLIEMPSYAILAAGFWIPFMVLLGFPAVFLMRAIGLFGYYFRPELELENVKKANVPCGFWPRWLAYLIDVAVITFVMLVAGALFGILGYVAWMFGLGASVLILLQVYDFGGAVFQAVYFIGSESGIGQATVGKRALGIIVTDLEGQRISKGTATGRYFAKILSALPLAIGFFMAGFTEKKQAWHDQLAKTLVVWQGDDART